MRITTTRIKRLVLSLCVAGLLPQVAAAGRKTDLDQWEIHFPNKDYKRLDTLEALALNKADKAFAKENWTLAYNLYEAFELQYGRSKAIPYALLRKGRCLQKNDKRFDAIKDYQAVLDYFPNYIRYAAPAVYYRGLCHWQNGDEKKAMVEWSKMAKDPDYSKHFLAAPALLQLAEHLAKQDYQDRAVEYYRQVAVNFRTANKSAANDAMNRVIRYYVRTVPDEPKLRSFYIDVRGFRHSHPRKIEQDPKKPEDWDKNWDYWGDRVRDRVKDYGKHFKEGEGELRKEYFRYWARQLDGKFDANDDYQIDVANFYLAATGNVVQWMQRLDAQFADHQKDGQWGRIIRWMKIYGQRKDKAKQYYSKLEFDKMGFEHVFEAMKVLWDDVSEPSLAEGVFNKLKGRLGSIDDEKKKSLERYFWRKAKGGENSEKFVRIVKEVCARFEDKNFGQAELMRFYARLKDVENGVPVCDKLTSVAEYVDEALWTKARLLHEDGQHKKAIMAYRACNNPPDNIWKIAECYVALKQMGPAIRELDHVENMFRDRHGPRAAMKKAEVYKRLAPRKLKAPKGQMVAPQFVGQLRRILQKYEVSGEASRAHVELEHLGYDPGGGEDAKD